MLTNLLASTASPVLWYDGRRTGTVLAPVAQQGAGLIQVYDAAFTSTSVNASGVALNDTDHFVAGHAFTITNNSTQEANYELGHIPAATLYFSSGSYLADHDEFAPSSFPPELTSGAATLSFSSSTVHLAPGACMSPI
jgi:hypothetical protein